MGTKLQVHWRKKSLTITLGFLRPPLLVMIEKNILSIYCNIKLASQREHI